MNAYAMNKFKIELGHLPHKNLSPNARLHHMMLYKAKREAKEEAFVILSHLIENILPTHFWYNFGILTIMALHVTSLGKIKGRRHARSI